MFFKSISENTRRDPKRRARVQKVKRGMVGCAGQNGLLAPI